MPLLDVPPRQERLSLYFSAGALALSACALFISLDHVRTGAGGAMQTINEPRERRVSNNVRLEGLVIEQVRIAPLLELAWPTCDHIFTVSRCWSCRVNLLTPLSGHQSWLTVR